MKSHPQVKAAQTKSNMSCNPLYPRSCCCCCCCLFHLDSEYELLSSRRVRIRSIMALMRSCLLRLVFKPTLMEHSVKTQALFHWLQKKTCTTSLKDKSRNLVCLAQSLCLFLFWQALLSDGSLFLFLFLLRLLFLLRW